MSRASTVGVAMPVTVTKNRCRSSEAARRLQRPLGELRGDLREGRVALLKGVQRRVGLERQRQMPAGHSHCLVQVIQSRRIEVALVPEGAQRFGQRFLARKVGRQRSADARDDRRPRLPPGSAHHAPKL